MAELSYVHGVSATPLIGQTIGRYFDRICAEQADHEALIVRDQNRRFTYAQLRQQVDALACGLRRLGLQPGERIGLWSQNNTEWVLTQFATAKAGLVLVNINPAYRAPELEYALKKVGCRALILAPAFRSSDYLMMLRELAPEIERCEPGALRADRLPELQIVIRLGEEPTPGMLNFDSLLQSPSAQELQELDELGERLQFDDPINIQFTSGTTGSPKGATLTHHNLLNNAYFVTEAMHFTAADRLCIPVPLYHCFGMSMGTLGCVTHGATMILPAGSFDPKATLATLQEERCTAIYGVPMMFIAMLDHPDFGDYDLGTLRTGVMAGSPCPIEIMKRAIEKMHMREVTIAYGMTETAPVSFQSDTTDTVERRVSTVGRVLPHLEVKIVDGEGHIVPRGSSGELCTRGYSVMLGYWGDPEKTAEAIDKGGWMHTGDLGTMDEQGYCRIVGRSKDMVIRGGENLYPVEIEDALYRHPEIQDVQVVGVPDPKYGEELCAWIIRRPDAALDEAGLRRFCADRMTRHKIPRYICFVDSFPTTVTGKVQKFRIRAQMVEELGLDA